MHSNKDKHHSMASHNELGKWGEDIAADYLQRQGYTIIERNWKSGHRDLDIIALDGQTLVIAEVKTRGNRLTRKWLLTTRRLFIFNKLPTTMSNISI